MALLLCLHSMTSSPGVLTRDDNLSCNALHMLEGHRFDSQAAACNNLHNIQGRLMRTLPARSDIEHLLPIIDQCAVVGRAPNLIGLGLGSEIDRAGRVFRTNRFQPAEAGKPYTTEDFGSRPADVDILNTWMLNTNRAKPYLHIDAWNCSYHGRATQLELYNPAAVTFLAQYINCMERRSKHKESHQPIWVMHPKVPLTAAWLLDTCVRTNASSSQAAVPSQHQETFPSHGFLAVIFALTVCRNVSLYGFEERRRGDPPAGDHAWRGQGTYGSSQEMWGRHAINHEHAVLHMLAHLDDPRTPPAVRQWMGRMEHTPRVLYTLSARVDEQQQGAQQGPQQKMDQLHLEQPQNDTSNGRNATVDTSSGRWALCVTGEPRGMPELFTIMRLLSNLVGALPSSPELFVSTT